MPDKPDRVIDTEARLQRVKKLLPESLRHPAVLALIQLSLAEDLSAQADLAALGNSLSEADVTSLATLPPESRLDGRINAKASGIVAGLPVAAAVYQLVDPNIHFKANANDGELVESGRLLAEVRGPGRGLLAGERTALNFLGRLSGIASLTRKFVDAIAGTNAVILDTRKTAPGLRHLDKYAVRMGGGQNHRTGLFDMVLIKDNHIDGAGGIEPAVQRVRKMYGKQYQIEVEVKNLDELEQALRLQVDRIMLDNMDLETMRIAVLITNKRIPLEASGNVTLTSVRKIAETGVDYISSGALTHSAPVLDISMRLK
jgi:nicotinate-nucleotide pyrophosphorylase (carboxylating)